MTKKRATEHTFARVPQATIPRSRFNRSHSHKFTGDAGYLLPCYVDEVLPGDSFNLNMTVFARLATPTFPIMDNLTLSAFFFFVPNRLVWDNWTKFCGEQIDPDDSISFTIPQMTSPTGAGVLAATDLMGIPPGFTETDVNALPFRALNLIYNEWFRDQNLQDSVTVTKGDGPEASTAYRVLRRRGKRHDYFTSSLPWPQKQTLPVTIPLGTTAPVERITSTSKIGVQYTDDLPELLQSELKIPTTAGSTDMPVLVDSKDAHAVTAQDLEWGTSVGLQTDLSTATAVTINALRQSFQIQKLLERDARGGTRYTEIVKAHYGVSSPDSRLQRSEFLGSGRTPVIIQQVARTTPSIGELGAYGTATGSNMGFNKSFTEHGYIIGLISIQADLTYQQGLHRMWSRLTRYDFYWPAFSHLGEQSVLNQEIYFQNHDAGGASPNDDNHKVWGYQERWAEYRYSPSRISGMFRSDHATPLDAWHLAQQYTALPILGDVFIQDTPPVARVIETSTDPHFLIDTYFDIKCARTMPVYGVPGMIDHF